MSHSWSEFLEFGSVVIKLGVYRNCDVLTFFPRSSLGINLVYNVIGSFCIVMIKCEFIYLGEKMGIRRRRQLKIKE